MQKLLARLFPFIQEALAFKAEAQKLFQDWMDYGAKHATDAEAQGLRMRTNDLLKKARGD